MSFLSILFFVLFPPKVKNQKLTARLHKHPPVGEHRVLVDGQAGPHAGDASFSVGPAKNEKEKKEFLFLIFGGKF